MEKETKNTLSENILSILKLNDQTHLIEAFDNLNDENEKISFINSLEKIDFNLMTELFKCTKTNIIEDSKMNQVKNVTSLKELTPEKKKELHELGMEILSEGGVAIIMMAGGQGSRLGFEHPKGMYNIGLSSSKSIFQIHAEKILGISKLSIYKEKLLINNKKSKDSSNDKETKEFFEKNNYFGLKKDRVIFFQQNSLPALDKEGKIFLQEKNEVFFAPNGNGAIYSALNEEGLLKNFKEKGIKFVNVIGVDNILIKLFDPVFVGFAAKNKSQISSKYISKRNAEEKVGVHVLVNDRPFIKEYSEFSTEQINLRNENGELTFSHGCALSVIYSVEFLDYMLSPAKLSEFASKYHIAKKKIKYYDIKSKKKIEPSEINGYKFELFFFDSFPFADSMSILEMDRNEEFAPIKNAVGTLDDNPETARKMMSKLHQKWLINAGMKFKESDEDHIKNFCEISSLISYNGEGLIDIAKKYQDKEISLPFYLL